MCGFMSFCFLGLFEIPMLFDVFFVGFNGSSVTFADVLDFQFLL